MADPRRPSASTPGVRRRMQAAKPKDTASELELRRALHRRGLRYRVEMVVPPLTRRRMDIVFTKAKIVVSVHGCWWHSCPDHATLAKANGEYWAGKLAANKARDLDTEHRLKRAGWTVLRVWGHEDPRKPLTASRTPHGRGLGPGVRASWVAAARPAPAR